MRVRLNGTRGSVGRAGPATVRYGGDTSSVEVSEPGGSVLVLDAGSGIVHSECAGWTDGRVDILLTHLHMDHIQGLGFFRPLFESGIAVHVWGPISTTSLTERLSRYLSPPLFPVRLRDLPAVTVHDLAPGTVEIGRFSVSSDFIIHPGQTFGYRIESGGRALAYLPDHEPSLGLGQIPRETRWTSGHALAADADGLIHDAQFDDDEYSERVGWGHSSLTQALDFAELANVRRLITFHHEPNHSDEQIDAHHADVLSRRSLAMPCEPGLAGAVFDI